MNTTEHKLVDKVGELRRSFDRSFATPRLSPAAPADDLLMVRSHGRRYALRIAELHGLHAGPPITPLPSTDPALLGIAGIRGQLVPVYSMTVLLGGDGHASTHRWLVVCKHPKVTVALAFDEFAGSIRILKSALHVPSASQPLPPHIAQVACLAAENCYVISTESILNDLVGRTGENRPAGDGDRTDANTTRE